MKSIVLALTLLAPRLCRMNFSHNKCHLKVNTKYPILSDDPFDGI